MEKLVLKWFQIYSESVRGDPSDPIQEWHVLLLMKNYNH